MLDDFGKAVRNIRIERNELLFDMANKLELSSARLSGVECGRYSIPPAFISTLSRLYCLKESKKQNLEKLALLRDENMNL